MSHIPFLLNDFSHRPPIIFSQQFGLGLDPEDMLNPSIPPEYRMTTPFSYYRPRRSQAVEEDDDSADEYDKDKFQVSLDVRHFEPEEITVKLVGENMITIVGKHEEKEDEHGFVYRHFVRKYTLPEGHDIHKLESKLSSDGVLTIIAPKANQETIEGHKIIPIQQTGLPARVTGNRRMEDF